VAVTILFKLATMLNICKYDVSNHGMKSWNGYFGTHKRTAQKYTLSKIDQSLLPIRYQHDHHLCVIISG